MAGVFQVMAFAVSAMDKRDADPALMSKLAKIATSEMITSKVWNGFYLVDELFFLIMSSYMYMVVLEFYYRELVKLVEDC